MNEERRIENISIHKIIPNIYQPRIKFDDKSITELSESIKIHGIIQPLILRKIGTSYEIIDGERRYKAAKKINLQYVPSIILDIDDKEVAELILTENMQKQLLTPIEEANAYQQMMLLNKLNIEELSKKLNREKSIIEGKLKLLTLATEIQEALLDNKISEGHAKLLTKINKKEKQIELFNKILKERIPVKKLEEIINKENEIKKIEKDCISLNDLNKKEFLKSKKESKMEEEKMNNTQLNFNQYNNLLKEQERPTMQNSMQPEPIIGNIMNEQKKNEFFPSLEDQPLNLNIPVNNEQPIQGPVEMQQFEVPTPISFQEPTMVEPPIEKGQKQGPMEMPQFEVPTPIPAQEPTMMQPPIEIGQMQGPMEMPQFEVPSPIPVQEPTMMQSPIEAGQMQGPMEMPQFEVPSPIPVQEPTMMQSPIEIGQMQGSMEMPQFEVPTPIPAQEPTMMQPPIEIGQMQGSMEMQQFEVPSPIPVQEPTMMQPPIEPEQPYIMTDVMPAVNMIRNLIPLLENSGYKINIEEVDNTGEYQIILKVQK